MTLDSFQRSDSDVGNEDQDGLGDANASEVSDVEHSDGECRLILLLLTHVLAHASIL